MNNKGDADNMIKNNDKSIVLGIDIGGTTCKCGVVTTDGELLYKDEIPAQITVMATLVFMIVISFVTTCVNAAAMSGYNTVIKQACSL